MSNYMIISRVVCSMMFADANIIAVRNCSGRMWRFMPVVTILCMPTRTEQDKLDFLTERIKEAVAAVPILDIPGEEVFVFYQPDLQQRGLGEELIAKIEGLYQKPERTSEVLRNLQVAICDCLKRFARAELPQCTSVEAFINTMIPPEHCTIIDLES